MRVNTQTTGIKITNTGNVGIKNINPQSALDVTGSIAASGPISVTDDTASTSVSTGALKVSGGVGISKAAYIGGDLTVSGTTTSVNSTNTTIADTLVVLQSGLTGANPNDIGHIYERGTDGNNGFFGWDQSTRQCRDKLSQSMAFDQC